MTSVKPLPLWTVLVYAGGANNLDGYLTQNLRELESEAIPANVDVVVRQVHAGGEAEDFQLSAQGRVNLGKSSLDSASPQALADLLRLGIERYPARHYLLIIGSHGKGAGGIIEDEPHHTSLSLPDLSRALARDGPPLDAVFFSACKMMTVEMASELQGRAQVAVGSMDLISGPGYDLREVVKAAAGSADAKELGRRLVDNAEPRQLEACNSLSAVELARVRPLEEALAVLSGQLARLDPDSARAVRQLAAASRRTTPSPTSQHLLDDLADYVLAAPTPATQELQDWLDLSRPGEALAIVPFCQSLAERFPDFDNACQAVLAAHRQAVFRERSAGLSVELPLERNGAAPLYSSPLEFQRATDWQRAVDTVVPAGVPACLPPTWLEAELQHDRR